MYPDKENILTGVALQIIPVLKEAATRAYGFESRLFWYDLVREMADTLYDRPDWSEELTLSMRQWLQFTDRVGYTNPNFPRIP